MAKAPPSFQFYPADFLVGTAGMSHSSKATFLLLLCYEWTQKNVRFDPDKLAKMVGISRGEFDSDWEELSSKFTIDEEGCIRNEKLETIRREAVALSRARAAAGRKGGLSKAKAKLKQRVWQKASKGSLKSKDCSMNSKQKKEETISANFEAFWLVVNRKTAKAGCRARYAKAVAEIAKRGNLGMDPHAYLRQRMAEYAASPRGRGPYAWEPLAWLRDGHYDDDPEVWQDGGGNSRAPDAQPNNGKLDPLSPEFIKQALADRSF